MKVLIDANIIFDVDQLSYAFYKDSALLLKMRQIIVFTVLSPIFGWVFDLYDFGIAFGLMAGVFGCFGILLIIQTTRS